MCVCAEEEARFIKNLFNVEGTETDSVKLICEVSKPSADVIWYKGDEELPEGGRFDMMVDGKRRILLIKDLKMEDGGEYNCRLSPSIRTSGNLKINGTQTTSRASFIQVYTINLTRHSCSCRLMLPECSRGEWIPDPEAPECQ